MGSGYSFPGVSKRQAAPRKRLGKRFRRTCGALRSAVEASRRTCGNHGSATEDSCGYGGGRIGGVECGGVGWVGIGGVGRVQRARDVRVFDKASKLPTANSAPRDKQQIGNLMCLRASVLNFLNITNIIWKWKLV